jgi:hypothetical protein
LKRNSPQWLVLGNEEFPGHRVGKLPSRQHLNSQADQIVIAGFDASCIQANRRPPTRHCIDVEQNFNDVLDPGLKTPF